MDRRERINDLNEALLVAQQSVKAELWTSLPGIIDTFDATKQTATVRPAIQIQQRLYDGSTRWVTMPLLLDCPVQFPSGGGFSMTFPIKPGDECLVVFADRCIDAWWQSGAANGAQPQAELRMHDLSDGFVIAGFRSQPRKLANYSTTDAELRTDDGQAHVRIAANYDVKVLTPAGAFVEAASKIQLKAPLIEIIGNVTVTGTVIAQGDVVGQGTTLHNHIHTAVRTGSDTSGPPAP